MHSATDEFGRTRVLASFCVEDLRVDCDQCNSGPLSLLLRSHGRLRLDAHLTVVNLDVADRGSTACEGDLTLTNGYYRENA